jgi:hypothetical protein
MLSISKRFKTSFAKQSLRHLPGSRSLMAIAFTGTLLVSTLMLFSTQPAVSAGTAKAGINKCKVGKGVASKAIPIVLNRSTQGIAAPSAPVRKSDLWKVSRNPFDFRAGRLPFAFLNMDEGDCPESASCSTGCGGSLSCGQSGTFMQALSECSMRCCWCSNPGNCSQAVDCNSEG